MSKIAKSSIAVWTQTQRVNKPVSSWVSQPKPTHTSPKEIVQKTDIDRSEKKSSSMSDFFEYKFYTRDKLHCDKFLYNNKTFRYNVNDPKDRNLALNEIKQLIGESIDFALKDKSCADDDEFLLRFLFARDFVISDAFKLLINYLSFKQRNVNILSKISALDEGIQLALRDGFPTIIPQRDRKGRKILVLFAANWNPNAYSLITVFRALLLSMEKLLEDIQNQANGFVMIVDWTNFTYKQTGSLQLKVIKIMIEGLQVSDFWEKSVFFYLNFKFQLYQFIFPGLFPGQIQRSAFRGPAMVCWSNTDHDSTVFAGRNSGEFVHAWRKFINTSRQHSQRRTSNRIGRRNKIDKSIGLGSYFTRIQPKSKRMSTLSIHTID